MCVCWHSTAVIGHTTETRIDVSPINLHSAEVAYFLTPRKFLRDRRQISERGREKPTQARRVNGVQDYSPRMRSAGMQLRDMRENCMRTDIGVTAATPVQRRRLRASAARCRS